MGDFACWLLGVLLGPLGYLVKYFILYIMMSYYLALIIHQFLGIILTNNSWISYNSLLVIVCPTSQGITKIWVLSLTSVCMFHFYLLVHIYLWSIENNLIIFMDDLKKAIHLQCTESLNREGSLARVPKFTTNEQTHWCMYIPRP